ncbi:MAG TPA: MarR family transcriptional regulator [Anaerolineales bacterium]|nr:MarR family transcriptional regulator [Anaerolineales bacterium]
MSTGSTAEQFIELIQKYISLRPKLILPEHVIEFKKKMASFRSSGYSSEDHAFVFRILMLLSQNAEPITMGELSSELNVPMSTATRIVDGLVRGGMAERVNDSNDRRIVRVGMSRNGRELYETGIAYNKQRIAKLLKTFTAEEQTQLLKLMNKLFDALLDEK